MISHERLNALDYKLIVTIVKKGAARKVVKAAKGAGAQGSTILLGTGHGIHEQATFLGIHLEPEKEIVLTAVPTRLLDEVIGAISADCRIDQPGMGIGFVVDINAIAGVSHPPESGAHGGAQTANGKESEATMDDTKGYDLIVTIVNKGNADTVVNASKKAGAEGGTILYGRGTGIHEQAKLFSIPIEPEKDLVLTLIERDKTGGVLRTILNDAELAEPGKGIAFVLPVERAVGIHHRMDRQQS